MKLFEFTLGPFHFRLQVIRGWSDWGTKYAAPAFRFTDTAFKLLEWAALLALLIRGALILKSPLLSFICVIFGVFYVATLTLACFRVAEINLPESLSSGWRNGIKGALTFSAALISLGLVLGAERVIFALIVASRG